MQRSSNHRWSVTSPGTNTTFSSSTITSVADDLRDPGLISFMKMLVPYHKAVRSHDLLMVLDVDILISAKTPPFHALDLGARIGVVDEWCQPSREERVKFQAINGLEPSPREYYRLAGFAMESEILINSGMFICAPHDHGAFFRDIVARHTETQRGHPRGIHSNRPCSATSCKQTTSRICCPLRGTAFGRIIGARRN